MKFEQRDFIRWFKKGWVLLISQLLMGMLLAGFFGLSSFRDLADAVVANPAGALTSLIAIGLFSLAWGLFLYPIINGFLIEEIDKRIRK